jgi:renalase
MASDEVLVVGGGIAGVTCARVLHEAGVPVVVRDRGHRLGGRMAVRTVDGRPVDVGASYFTVAHPLFQEQVDAWRASGLARPWTDTFHVGSPDGLSGTVTGPVRHATPLGLRSLVEALAVGLPVSHPDEVQSVLPGPVVDGEPFAAVALAMPGPQALDLLADGLADERRAADRAWEPCLSLVACWPKRAWRQLDGVFVQDSSVLTWVADDGRRRGDGAPVLVAHSDPVLAAAHLDAPDTAAPLMLDELRRILEVAEPPARHLVKRWSLAKPVGSHDQSFHLGPERVGLCGDGWHGASRIESAYLSGHALGRALTRLLAA